MDLAPLDLPSMKPVDITNLNKRTIDMINGADPHGIQHHPAKALAIMRKFAPGHIEHEHALAMLNEHHPEMVPPEYRYPVPQKLERTSTLPVTPQKEKQKREPFQFKLPPKGEVRRGRSERKRRIDLDEEDTIGLLGGGPPVEPYVMKPYKPSLYEDLAATGQGLKKGFFDDIKGDWNTLKKSYSDVKKPLSRTVQDLSDAVLGKGKLNVKKYRKAAEKAVFKVADRIKKKAKGLLGLRKQWKQIKGRTGRVLSRAQKKNRFLPYLD